MFQQRIAMPFTFVIECSRDPITQRREYLSHVEVQLCLLHESPMCYVYNVFTLRLEQRNVVFKLSTI